MTRLTRRGEIAVGLLAPVAIIAATWAAGALGNVLTGEPLTSSTTPDTVVVVTPAPAVAGTGKVLPRQVRATPTPRANRSRPTASPAAPSLNWTALAACESGGNPRAVSPSGRYYGLYQFDEPTWRSVGGVGNPADASPAEQTHRARLLYQARGRSPWPVCGRRL